MVRPEAQALSHRDQTEYLKVEQDPEDETWDLHTHMGLLLVKLGGSWSSAVLGLVFCSTDVLQPVPQHHCPQRETGSTSFLL